MVSFRDIVYRDVLYSRLRCCACDVFGHTLGVAIHRAVADNESFLGLLLRHTVVHPDYLIYVFVPHRTVCRADIIELHARKFLQCVLHRHAVFAHDVGVVAHHLQPERVAVDVLVDYSAVERTETAESIAREQRVCRSVERNHSLRPVYHRSEYERQFVASQVDEIAVFHLSCVVVDAIEALNHAVGFLVSHDFYFGIILLYQCDRAAMVGFHVVDYEIIHLPVADNSLYVLDELGEKVHFDRIYQCHFLVGNEIRVIRNAIWQWPQSFEQRLVAVVHSYVINFVSNLYHNLSCLLSSLLSKPLKLLQMYMKNPR